MPSDQPPPVRLTIPVTGTYSVLVRSRSARPFIVGEGGRDLACPECAAVLVRAVAPEGIGGVLFRGGLRHVLPAGCGQLVTIASSRLDIPSCAPGSAHAKPVAIFAGAYRFLEERNAVNEPTETLPVTYRVTNLERVAGSGRPVALADLSPVSLHSEVQSRLPIAKLRLRALR